MVKEITFYFELHSDFPYKSRKEFNPYYENGKEYNAFCIEPFSLVFGKANAYLFVDGSSVLGDGGQNGK